MSVFNTNQVRQFYVATSYNNSGAEGGKTIDDATVSKGAIEAKCKDNELYFLYKGADGVLKSDRIQLKNLDYVKAVKASDMVTPLKQVKVTLASDINEGKVVKGQDYLLRIVFKQFYGMSDQDQYIKDVAVHGTTAMESSSQVFYEALKSELDKCFSREIGATKSDNPYLKFTASANGLTIQEKEQEWNLGVGSVQRVYFDVYCTTIQFDGEEEIWGVVEDTTPAKADATVGTNAVGNGKQIADMEWFYLGERGDQYRMMGYPNYIPTAYMVDPAKQYNVLEIHYAFTDTGVNSYRTEKDITIVAEQASVINSLVTAINDAAGLEIAAI